MKLSSNNLTECKLFVPKLFFSRQYMPLLLLRHIDTKKCLKHLFIVLSIFTIGVTKIIKIEMFQLASCLLRYQLILYQPAAFVTTETLHLLPKYIIFISKIHVDIFFTSIHLRNNSVVALFLCPFFKKGRKDCSLSLLLALGRLSPSSSVTTYIICNI